MFSVSFFLLRQNLWPFFIFLFSYSLGASGSSNGRASSGVFRAQFTAIGGQIPVFWGAKSPLTKGIIFCLKRGKCPNYVVDSVDNVDNSPNLCTTQYYGTGTPKDIEKADW
jgi:hypothetical protein